MSVPPTYAACKPFMISPSYGLWPTGHERERAFIFARIEVDENSGCWLWTGHINRSTGYARTTWLRPDRTVHQPIMHRVSYEVFRRPIPDGLSIDHLCSVRHCVNPWHLEPVSPDVNTQRGKSGKGRLRHSHCINGHEFTEANTLRYRGGWRGCLQCRRKCSRDWRLRHKKAIS